MIASIAASLLFFFLLGVLGLLFVALPCSTTTPTATPSAVPEYI